MNVQSITVNAPKSIAWSPTQRMVREARELAEGHPDRRAARGDLEAHQLLDPHREPHVVAEGREVVHPVGDRDRLVVGAVLRDLFEAAVEVADLGLEAHDALAVELDDVPERPVRGRVLRPEIDDHPAGAEIAQLFFLDGQSRTRTLFRHSLKSEVGSEKSGRTRPPCPPSGGRSRTAFRVPPPAGRGDALLTSGF
jgi:hypothetical protein